MLERAGGARQGRERPRIGAARTAPSDEPAYAPEADDQTSGRSLARARQLRVERGVRESSVLSALAGTPGGEEPSAPQGMAARAGCALR